MNAAFLSPQPHRDRFPRPQTALWVMFIATIVAIAAFAIYKKGDGLVYYDEIEYWQMARSIADGNGLAIDGTATAYKPPVWPAAIATLLLIGTPPALLPLLSVSSLAGAALLARGIACELAGTVAGWIAAFGMLLYPLNVYTAATLYPQTLATLLLLLPIYLVQRNAPRRRVLLAVGASLALLVLTVPTMASAALVVAGWALWRFRAAWARVVLVAGLAGLLPIAVWATRNYVELGSPVLISTATGVNLLMGNSPNATALTGSGTDITDSLLETDGMDEVQRNSYLTAQALSWVSENPADAGSLYAAKVLNFFAPYNAPQSAGQGSSLAMLIGWATFVPLLVLAISRVALAVRVPVRSPEALMWTLYLTSALFMAVTFTRTRFRQPLDSFLIIEAAVLLGAVAMMVRRQAQARLATRRQLDRQVQPG